MFTSHSNDGYTPVLDGITMKTIAWCERTLMTEFRLDAGRELPLHDHPHEQTGYLVSGHIRLTIGDDVHDVHPGDAWAIPSGMPHKADIIENAVAIEVFSPVREDYLPG